MIKMPSRFSDYTVSVGTSSTLIVPSVDNAKILHVSIRNISTAAQDITLSIGNQTASKAGGIILKSDASGLGEEASWSIDNRYDVPNLDYFGIASAVGGTVSVHLEVGDE